MSQLKTSLGFVAAASILVFASASANAQATRTWVSGVGDDANPCSRTAPCKTFAGAISKTARAARSACSIPAASAPSPSPSRSPSTARTAQGYGSILAALATGVIINITDPTDVRRTVRLIWLDINGVGNGHQRRADSEHQPRRVSVVIENSKIDGFTGRGISDERTNGGKLVVSDTTVRHTVDSGIRIAAGGVNRIDATLTNVRVHNSAVAALTVNGGAKAMVSNSVFSGSTIGLDIEQANTERDRRRQHDQRQYDRHLHERRRGAAALQLQRFVQRHGRERDGEFVLQQPVRRATARAARSRRSAAASNPTGQQ